MQPSIPGFVSPQCGTQRRERCSEPRDEIERFPGMRRMTMQRDARAESIECTKVPCADDAGAGHRAILAVQEQFRLAATPRIGSLFFIIHSVAAAACRSISPL